MCSCYLRQQPEPSDLETSAQRAYHVTDISLDGIKSLILLKDYTVGRVNFCQKHPNISAESFYCVFWYTDQPQKISA